MTAYASKPSNRVVDGTVLTAVVVLALCVRFYAITEPAIWYDEAFSVLLARHEPGQIWSITAKDVHPPFYYLVLHYWTALFGDGVLAVRSLSAVADVGTVVLSTKLMSLMATRRATWVAASMLALLPISVRYSQEARMYTLLGFWLMGATVALVCWVQRPDKKRFSLIYMLFMTAAFYTHYFAALCVLVHWFYWYWGVTRPARVVPVRGWLLINGAIVMLFMPWLPHFIEHLSGKGLEWIPPVTADAVLSLVWQFTVMNGWGTSSWLLRVILLAGVIACAALLVFKNHEQCHFNSLLIGYFFIPVGVLALVALVVPVFVPRYLVFAAVGVPLIVAVALDVMGRRTGLPVLVLMGMLIAEIEGLRSVYRHVDGLNGTDDRTIYGLDNLVPQIERAIRPGDAIVLSTLYWYLPFSYYNRTGVQPRVYVPELASGAMEVRDHGAYALIPEPFKGFYFHDPEVLRCPGSRVWWVASKKDGVPPFPEKNWTQGLTLVDEKMIASLFIPKAPLPSVAKGSPVIATQQPIPMTKNCPP